MKKIKLMLAAGTASLNLLLASYAVAEPLSKEESIFVIVSLGRLIVPAKCDAYQIVEGGLLRFGDTTGVDAPRFARAIAAAASAIGGGDYDRNDLIPEVTRAVKTEAEEMQNEITSSTKAFCKKWGAMLVENRVAKAK